MCLKDRDHSTRVQKSTELTITHLVHLPSYWFLSKEISQKDTALWCVRTWPETENRVPLHSGLLLFGMYFISLRFEVIPQ